MKRKAMALLERLCVATAWVLYPAAAVLAAPWAYIISRRSWGYTSWVEWRETWGQLYSPQALRGLYQYLVGRV